jgi:hypothetical protein
MNERLRVTEVNAAITDARVVELRETLVTLGFKRDKGVLSNTRDVTRNPRLWSGRVAFAEA